jgi:hypothetical protein
MVGVKMIGRNLMTKRIPAHFMWVMLLFALGGCAAFKPTLNVSLTNPVAASPTGLPASGTPTASMPVPQPSVTFGIAQTATLTPEPTAAPSPAPTRTPGPVPEFSHVFFVILENREFGFVVGNSIMPVYNQWASQYTLLTSEFAITHPSLPNYLALIGGDTFNITSDCTDCFINAPSLPDQIEASGRTWKTYQEDLPSPCFTGSRGNYAQKHNPFIYFDPIRLDPVRCQRSIVPLTQLTADLSARQLPDFAMIVPNMCNSGHDCDLDKVDAWLTTWVSPLIGLDARSLIIITWDEGQGDHGCCGLNPAGGRVATLLISDLAKPAFQDNTPYTHYSLLKTIETAWDLPLLGHAADPQMVLLTVPWKR